MAKSDETAPKKPKSTRKSKSADVGTPAIEVNPQLAGRPGLEVAEDRRSAQGRSPHLEIAQTQLNELQELLTHIGTSHPKTSGLVIDATKRIAALRKTLGI